MPAQQTPDYTRIVFNLDNRRKALYGGILGDCCYMSAKPKIFNSLQTQFVNLCAKKQHILTNSGREGIMNESL